MNKEIDVVYNRYGEPILRILDNNRIIGFDGKSVGFSDRENLYNYSGRHVGFLKEE